MCGVRVMAMKSADNVQQAGRRHDTSGDVDDAWAYP